MPGPIYWWGPPVLLMGAILWLSGEPGASDVTAGLLERLVRRLFPGTAPTPEVLAAVNLAVRKTGHVIGYALLGFLNMRAVLGGARRRTPAGIVLAWGVSAVWAAVDETRQASVPSRGGAITDVLLDALGAALGVTLYLLLHGLWNRRA